MSENKVKSFEVSDSEYVGDIVSRERKNRRAKLKIGLLCCGWFEWWPMFPHSDLEEKIRNDANNFVAELTRLYGNEYEFVYPKMTDTLDNAFDVGEMFKKENIEAVVLVENTYLTDFIPIEVLDHLPDIPIIIFATQASRTLAKDMTNIDVIRYEGLVGVAQIVGAFKKMGKKYRVVVGSIDDPESYHKLANHFLVLDLKKHLKSIDIGLLGHTFRGMYDIEIDKTKIKGTIGPNVLYIDVQHFLNIWEKLTPHEIDDYIRQLEEDVPIPMYVVNDEDRRKSVSVGVALEKLIRRFNLDALTLLGQHHVEVATRASADFSFYVVEKGGIMTTHEGDIGNLVTKVILHRISGKLPVFLEWTAYDEPSNTMLLTHHGVVDPHECAADIKKARWTPSPEKWDFTGNGFSIEYVAKPGKVTLASLINDYEGWKMLISQGECIELEQRPCFAPQFYFRPEIPVKNYIQDILEEGIAHHVILTYGDYRQQVELLADYLGIRKVII